MEPLALRRVVYEQELLPAFFYDDNCPACRTESLKETIEEDQEERERLAEEQREDLERSAEEQSRRLEEEKEALEEHAWRVEAAAEKQRRDIARAPQLQAEELVRGAQDLYKVGLHEKALAKAQRAIERDEGNIDAHVLASWALMRLGRHEEAKKYYSDQLALLAMPDYRDSPNRFFTVLSGLPVDEALVRDFCKVLQENSVRWSRHGPPYDLIKSLFDRKLLQDARKLAQGFVGKRDSLRLHALVLDIELALKTAPSGGLESYLRGIPFGKRDEVLREFTNVSASNELSEQTINMLREAISRRYQEWKAEIEKKIHELSISEANRTTSGHGWAYGISALIFLAGLCLGVFPPLLGLDVVPSDTTTPFLAFGALFGSILFGVWAGRIHKQRGVRKSAHRQIAVMEQEKESRWSIVGSPTVSARRPGGRPTNLRVLVLIAGMVAYLIFWAFILTRSLGVPVTTAGQAGWFNEMFVRLAGQRRSHLHQLAQELTNSGWVGVVRDVPATLEFKQRRGRLVGTLNNGEVSEELEVYIYSDDSLRMRGTSYRWLSEPGPGAGFFLDTFAGRLSTDSMSLSGNYEDTRGSNGPWAFSSRRVAGQAIVGEWPVCPGASDVQLMDTVTVEAAPNCWSGWVNLT